MIYRFLILSDEVENFKREIKIDADDNFHDLYKAIIQCTGYSDKEMASFFLCSDNWRRKEEITLVEMDTDSDEDPHIMEDTVLSDFLEDEKQKLVFVFDYVNDRALYLELSEIIPEKTLSIPQCTLSIGQAPAQYMDIEDVVAVTASISDMDETFYGDEGYNMDELDREGYDGLDDMPDNFSDSEPY